MPVISSFNNLSARGMSLGNTVRIVGGSTTTIENLNGVKVNHTVSTIGETTAFEIFGSGKFSILAVGGGGAGGGVPAINRHRAGGGGGAGGHFTVNSLQLINGYAYAEVYTGLGGISASSGNTSTGSGEDTVVTFYTDSTKTTTIASIAAKGGGGGASASTTAGARVSGASQGNCGGGGSATATTSGGGTANPNGFFYASLSNDSELDYSSGISLGSGVYSGAGGTNSTTSASGGGGGGMYTGGGVRAGYPGAYGSSPGPLQDTLIGAGGSGGFSGAPGIATSGSGIGAGGGGLGRSATNTASGVGANGTAGIFYFIWTPGNS